MKKRIKLFTLLPLVASCLAATGCSLLDKNAKTYYFQNLSPDFQITTKKMKLFFPDGGNVPYVDIAKFVKDFFLKNKCDTRQINNVCGIINYIN